MLPDVELIIVDEQGQAVLQGDVGEVFVKGPTVMPGYWKLPEESREALTKDGWFKTGDLGHLDEQGRLYISAGRKKDLIIRAGENVAPLASELKKYCREKLPPFSVPDHFQFYETLPKNPVGKILKTQLREEIRAALNPS